MKAIVTWKAGLEFDVASDSGFSIGMSGDGKNISPMESVLGAMGACSSVDVVEILKKGRYALEGCVCELEASRAESAPRVFTQVHAHYRVTGDDLPEKAVERAVALSAEKYCSVMLMLTGAVNITTSFEINKKEG